MKFDFSGRVALVTGATRGIGKQIADDFVQWGAELLGTGTDGKTVECLNKQAKALGVKKRYYCVDFTDHQSVKVFLKEIEKRRRIDICINNAGINRIDFLEDAKEKDFNDIVAVNLKGPYLLTRTVAKMMKKNRYGRIINMASIFGVVSKPQRSIYSMTKSGIIGFTKAVSNELAPYGVLVNAVSPGFILTDLTRKILSAAERKALTARIPVGRLGRPSDISGVVLFLASGVNSYITGKNIIVDGGFIDG